MALDRSAVARSLPSAVTRPHGAQKHGGRHSSNAFGSSHSPLVPSVPPLCRSGSEMPEVGYADLADWGGIAARCRRRRWSPRSAGSRSVSGTDTGRTSREMSGGKLDIKRSGSQPSGKGPADWFTGTVRIDPLFQAPDPARVVGASVTFEPGARTAWHTHPLGQTLIVTAGCGLRAALGRADRGDPAGRRGLVPARREALARRVADHGDDAHRHSGAARRQGRRLDGEGQRRTVSSVTIGAPLEER